MNIISFQLGYLIDHIITIRTFDRLELKIILFLIILFIFFFYFLFFYFFFIKNNSYKIKNVFFIYPLKPRRFLKYS